MLPILDYRKSCMIFNKALHLCVYELHVSQVEWHKPQKSVVSQLLPRLTFQSQGAGRVMMSPSLFRLNCQCLFQLLADY